MTPVDYAKSQVSSFLEEVGKLRDSEFPYPNSQTVVLEIEAVLVKQQEYLAKISATTDKQVIENLCASSVDAVSYYLPLLGFILRSTNVRNAFEIYGPLLHLVKTVLGTKTKLILSSEWSYSPFTYFGVNNLPEYVFIGFPAPESSNPLLIPIAGHELGHSVWNVQSLRTKYAQRLEDSIINQIKARWSEYLKYFDDIKQEDLASDWVARQTWEAALQWGLMQCEEAFCDLVGLRLFGESFLYSSAYLLSPSRLGQRSPEYPNTKRRIADLIEAANKYNIQIPPEYSSQFENISESQISLEVFLTSLADEASLSVRNQMIDEAKSILDGCNVIYSDSGKVLSLYESFKAAVPGSNAGCLADILNAAWKLELDPSVLNYLTQVHSKTAFIKELVLKTIEVFEYEQILKA
ncbi:MAG: hypothetical protein LV481_16435 [Methylacidiphilales bacterium]|nr:hypothetical protein [Candidatus Methylacidiphilales bacterium]